jgi:hypothetical protein
VFPSRHPFPIPTEGTAVDQQVSTEMKQNRMKEFMSLLPLTIELAGLAKAVPGQVFTADQIEGRALSIRSAFKAARNLVKDIGESGA